MLFLSLLEEFFREEEAASRDPRSPLHKGFEEFLINRYPRFNKDNAAYGKHAFMFVEYVRHIAARGKKDPRKLSLAENGLLRYIYITDFIENAEREKYLEFTQRHPGKSALRSYTKKGMSRYCRYLKNHVFKGKSDPEALARKFTRISEWQCFQFYLSGVITWKECEALIMRDQSLFEGMDLAGLGKRLTDFVIAAEKDKNGKSGRMFPGVLDDWFTVSRQQLSDGPAFVPLLYNMEKYIVPPAACCELSSAAIAYRRKMLILLLPGERAAGAVDTDAIPGADVVPVLFGKPDRYLSAIFFPYQPRVGGRPGMAVLYPCRDGNKPVFYLDVPADGNWRQDPAPVVKGMVEVLQYKNGDPVTRRHVSYIGLSSERWTSICLRGDTGAAGLRPGEGRPGRLPSPSPAPEANVIEVCDPSRMGPRGTCADAPAYFDELLYTGVDTVLLTGFFPGDGERHAGRDIKDIEQLFIAARDRRIRALIEYPLDGDGSLECHRDTIMRLMRQGAGGIVLSGKTGQLNAEQWEKWLYSIWKDMYAVSSDAVFAYDPLPEDAEAAGQWALKGGYFVVRRVNAGGVINEKYTGSELVLLDNDASALDETVRSNALSRLLEQHAPFVAYPAGMRRGDGTDTWQYPAERRGDISRKLSNFIRNRMMWLRYFALGEDIQLMFDPLCDRRESDLEKIIKNAADPLLSREMLSAA